MRRWSTLHRVHNGPVSRRNGDALGYGPVMTSPVDPPSPPCYVFVCNVCGSDQVTREAWAAWDVATQAWILNTAFDFAYCHRCLGYAQLDRLLLTSPPPGLPSRTPAFPPAPG